LNLVFLNLDMLPAALAPTINVGTGLPTAFISFGCPKETEPKKKHHETQPEISPVAQGQPFTRAAKFPVRTFRGLPPPHFCRFCGYDFVLFFAGFAVAH
jgi:hypothetical protein